MFLNPRAAFKFAVDLNGFQVFQVQKVTFPTVEWDVREHGEGLLKAKNPGMKSVGDMTMEALVPLIGPGDVGWEKFNSVFNTFDKTGTAFFKEEFTIRELGPLEETLSTYVAIGAWVKSITRNDADRQDGTTNIINTLVWSLYDFGKF